MPTTIPVDFEERVKRSTGTNASDYPYAISARDLMQDFVYAALDADETLIEEVIGQGGHNSRRLKIPAAPQSGTYVLGVKNGLLEWIETEDC
jgi:hypothetical protein